MSNTEDLGAFKDHYNLSEDDLNQEISDSHLDQIALKHCACWKLLSPHLDLGNMTINDITRSLTLATETDKRVEFFRQWKKVKGFEATYKKLVAALLKIDQKHEAGIVCKLLKQSRQSTQEQHKSAEENCSPETDLNPVADQAPLSLTDLRHFFPHLPANGQISEEKCSMLKEQLYQDLYVQTDKMKSKFASFKVAVQRDLESSGIEVETIVDFLVGYDDSFETVLSSCTRMSPLFRKIGKFMSFFDYNILEYLIENYGSDSIKERLKEYEGLFKDFSKRRVIECPSDAFGESEESERVVTLVSDKTLDALTLEDLKKFKYKVNSILGNKLIKVLRVEGGSVKITFRMFEFDKFSITEEQRILLQREGVISITYGDQHIEILPSGEQTNTDEHEPDASSASAAAHLEFRHLLVRLARQLGQQDREELMFLYKIPSVADVGLYALSQLQAEGHFDPFSPDKLQEIISKIGRNDLSDDIKEYKHSSVFKQAVKLEDEREESSKKSTGGSARLLSGAETAATEEERKWRDMFAMALTQTAQLVEQTELLRKEIQKRDITSQEALRHIEREVNVLSKAVSAVALKLNEETRSKTRPMVPPRPVFRAQGLPPTPIHTLPQGWRPSPVPPSRGKEPPKPPKPFTTPAKVPSQTTPSTVAPKLPPRGIAELPPRGIPKLPEGTNRPLIPSPYAASGSSEDEDPCEHDYENIDFVLNKEKASNTDSGYGHGTTLPAPKPLPKGIPKLPPRPPPRPGRNSRPLPSPYAASGSSEDEDLYDLPTDPESVSMREKNPTKCTTSTDSGYGHEDASWGGELIGLKPHSRHHHYENVSIINKEYAKLQRRPATSDGEYTVPSTKR